MKQEIPTSKVIQISEILNEYNYSMTVLCQDGSIWMKLDKDKSWSCILEAYQPERATIDER